MHTRNTVRSKPNVFAECLPVRSHDLVGRLGEPEMTGHRSRAMVRTILDEVVGYRPDFIEHQLGHAVRDLNGRACNKTAYLLEMQKMMQDWADYLDQLKAVNK